MRGAGRQNFPACCQNAEQRDSDRKRIRAVPGKYPCRQSGTDGRDQYRCPVSILRKLGIQLINIHGQHDSASLFDEDNHLTFLDAFGDNEAIRANYSEKYEAVSKLRREIDRISMDEGEKLRRMETLKFQINEIEKAELEAGEDEELEARRKILQNAEKLSDGMEEAVECLYGGDDSDVPVPFKLYLFTKSSLALILC